MILDELQLNPAKDVNKHQNIANLAKFIGRFFAFSTLRNLFDTLELATKFPDISYLSTPEGWEFDYNTTQFYQSVDNRGSGR
jgi:hypothetical protein